MTAYSEEDEERFANEVEALLGWTLDPEQRTAVAQRRERGESAAAIARAIESIAAAYNALNDRNASIYPSPTRPEDDAPRNFPESRTPTSRSEERRVGKECGNTLRSRLSHLLLNK